MLILLQNINAPKAQSKSSCPGLWGVLLFTRTESPLAKNVQVKMLKLGNALNGNKIWSLYSFHTLYFYFFILCTFWLSNDVLFAVQNTIEKLGLLLYSVNCMSLFCPFTHWKPLYYSVQGLRAPNKCEKIILYHGTLSCNVYYFAHIHWHNCSET